MFPDLTAPYLVLFYPVSTFRNPCPTNLPSLHLNITEGEILFLSPFLYITLTFVSPLSPLTLTYQLENLVDSNFETYLHFLFPLYLYVHDLDLTLPSYLNCCLAPKPAGCPWNTHVEAIHKGCPSPQESS